MKSLDNIAEDLFNKIRGRFPSVTIGDADGKITNDPLTARFFDFDYKEGDRNIGKVSISISEDKLAVMYSNSFVENEDTLTRQNWYNFLKELRTFAKKRLLQFDTRDITKSNLNKRDYEFLARQQGGDTTMSESKLYGTSRVSYQDVGTARLNIRHTQAVNPELAAGRTQHIDKIYVESADGERFMYPYRHLAGARAMARHVAEGGKPYDDFGQHITSLSEEVSKLRKFKTYMGRSSVMAEGLSGYLDAVVDRITNIKTELNHIQRPTTYKETFDNFEVAVMEDVPADVAENWIDQLTIRQFNEELKDIFPYVYRLVSEHTRAQQIGLQDLLDEEEVEEKRKCKSKKNMESELEASLDDILGQFGNEKPQPEKPEIPVTEFILSLFDRTTGEFPKGETAVLTAVEKDYGEQYINPAKSFIERIRETYDSYQMEANPQQMQQPAQAAAPAQKQPAAPAQPNPQLEKEIATWNDRVTKVNLANSMQGQDMPGGANVQKDAAAEKMKAETIAAAVQFRAKAISQGADPSKFVYDEKGNMPKPAAISQADQDAMMQDDLEFERMRELAGVR